MTTENDGVDGNSTKESHPQHMKDFMYDLKVLNIYFCFTTYLRLAIEFKYLMKNAPGGVYLMPEFENIRR